MSTTAAEPFASASPGVAAATASQPEPVDPTRFPAFVIQEAPKFDWRESGYVKAVLAAHGELVSHPDGSVARDDRPMLDRLEELVKSRVVTDANLDQAAYLGIDRGDLLSLLYGRPAAEALEYREESAFLTSTAWAALSPKGVISKRLDPGLQMVQSQKDTLSRIVTNADGSQGIQPVVVRMATSVPENVLNYAVSPAGSAALAAVRKAVRAATEAMTTFPDHKELFGNRLMLLNNELSSALADGLERAGYVLQPGKVTTAGELTTGTGKKGSGSKDPS